MNVYVSIHKSVCDSELLMLDAYDVSLIACWVQQTPDSAAPD